MSKVRITDEAYTMQDSHGRVIYIPRGGKCGEWNFNGDLQNPTFSPSLLVKYNYTVDDKKMEWTSHSFITDGKVTYLEDSTHKGKNQTLDLLEFDLSTDEFPMEVLYIENDWYE